MFILKTIKYIANYTSSAIQTVIGTNSCGFLAMLKRTDVRTSKLSKICKHFLLQFFVLKIL